MSVERTLLRQTRFWALAALIFLFAASAALAQTNTGPETNPAPTNGGRTIPLAPAPSSSSPVPQITNSDQPRATAEGAAGNRPNATRSAPKTLETTEFQRFVAESLGHVLPIYGTG